MVMDIFQSGFRNQHITKMDHLKALNDIFMAADSGYFVIMILIDLSPAFDN